MGIVHQSRIYTLPTRQGRTGYLAHPHYHLVVGDMGHTPALDYALDGVTDVVLLAGLVGDPITKKFPEESAAINDVALRNCIDQLNGRGLERVIFISTCSNYGLVEGDELVTEDSPMSPLSLYAESKVAAEKHFIIRGESISPTYCASQRFRPFATDAVRTSRERVCPRAVLEGLVVYDAQSCDPIATSKTSRP